MRLRELMRTRVVTIDAAEIASVAWSRMRRHRIRHLVVTNNGSLAGVISDRDLGGQGGAEVRKGCRVQDLMTSRVVSAEPTTTLRQAANLMRGRLIGSLPVLEGDQLVGIVTATDVLDELGRGHTRPTVSGRRGPLRASPPSRRQSSSNAIVRRRAPRSAVGRARLRKPDSRRRSPFLSRLPRASKREGSTEMLRIPAHIRAAHGNLGSDDRAYIRRKLGTKLGRFANSIERVSVRVEDVNGPRGGVDQACRIKAVLSGLPSVVFENQDASLNAAVDGALSGVERTVRRTLQRRRLKPLRHAA